MFKEIAEGIALYKKAAKDYKTKCSEIGKREKLSRQKDGRDYCGIIDWTPNDFRWQKTARAELSGMVKVLGLSHKEQLEIWREITDELHDELKAPTE